MGDRIAVGVAENGKICARAGNQIAKHLTHLVENFSRQHYLLVSTRCQFHVKSS
jgi:hypothetical protein